MRTPLLIIAALALSGCTESSSPSDLAHDAVHEMNLRIHPCGDSSQPCDEPEGTSALAIVAWTVENEDRVDAYPVDDGLMINFEDGSTLITEHFPRSGRLRSWTVR